MTNNAGTVISYNSANMPTSFTKGSISSSFKYDMNEQRYQKDFNGYTTHYIGKTYEKVKHDYNNTSEHFYYIYIDNKVVSIVNKKPDQYNVQYLHYDSLGSVDTITDNQGVVKQRITYKPFGEKIVTDFDSLFEVRRGYTGHAYRRV
ncbi:hypothetical protein ACOJTA_02670 [Malaciobacter sp. WC5094]